MITRRAALAALIVSAAGCVHYPSVMDVGGGRLRTEFIPDGPHVILTGLRPLTPRETFILTLQFERSGGIGVVTVVE